MEKLQELRNCNTSYGKRAGVTLVETIIAAGILAVFLCSALAAFVQLNRYAAVARCQTLALAFAQQKIDLILTTPWSVSGIRPMVLAAGTQIEPNLPLDNDSFNSQTALSSAFTSLDLQVNATRTTQITDVSARVVQAVVTITYTFKGTTYNTTLTTLRAMDSI